MDTITAKYTLYTHGVLLPTACAQKLDTHLLIDKNLLIWDSAFIPK